MPPFLPLQVFVVAQDLFKQWPKSPYISVCFRGVFLTLYNFFFTASMASSRMSHSTNFLPRFQINKVYKNIPEDNETFC